MEVEKERHDAVQVLRINRPEARNALNPAVMAGLGLGVEEADADPEIRAIIITGTGDRAFCAGMDLKGFAAGGTEASPDRRGVDAYMRLTREGSRKPLIGAANATAVAGGFEVLLACDMIVASSEAKFGLPEVKRALFPAGGGVFMGARIPLAVALELTLTGDYIDAERAQSLGLINEVVAPDEVMNAALALANRVAANGPLALEVTKKLVRMSSNHPAEEVWSTQEGLLQSVFGSEDAKEGATAFIERREPVWRGR